VVETGAAKRVPASSLAATLQRVAHFEGSVDGVEGSSCYLAFGATGAAGWIDLGGGRGTFTLRRVASDAPGLCAGTVEFVRSSGTSAPDVPACGGAHEGDGHDHGDGGIAGFGAVPPGVVKVVDMAIDSDYDYYRIFGNAPAATEYLATLTGAIAAIYRRDCNATIRISYVRLQTDAADLFNESDPLVPFRQYWNANGSGIDRDLFTLITGRRNLPYGGVAYLNAVCQNFGYSVNGYINGVFTDPVVTHPGNWDINVVAHEWGHNLGTRHTHDYGIDACATGTIQRGTIMSYCHTVQGASSNIDLRFHRGTAEAIESLIATVPCLGSDCNANGLDDAAEIDASPALDGNGDGIVDACQDCNANGVPDPVEIAAGAASDVDGDGRPDACERDCDGNGTIDSIEITLNADLDKDGDMQLDACQEDCNGNGTADAVEILADMPLDRSRDGRIDACEDCDGDGTDDFTELRGSRSRWVASSSDALLRELDPRAGPPRPAVRRHGQPRVRARPRAGLGCRAVVGGARRRGAFAGVGAEWSARGAARRWKRPAARIRRSDRVDPCCGWTARGHAVRPRVPHRAGRIDRASGVVLGGRHPPRLVAGRRGQRVRRPERVCARFPRDVRSCRWVCPRRKRRAERDRALRCRG
jgi:hypothetical protein